MFFPLVAIVACIGLVIYAVGNGPDMVVDDYYKKGKAINLELSKFNKAKALYIHGDLQVSDDKITFLVTKGDDQNTPTLKLAFYHNTIKAKDREFTLTRNANGQFVTLLDSAIPQGTYTVFLTPFNDTWKLKTHISLPNSQTIAVTPEYK